MNLQEMIDQVSDELRNSNIETKIKRWLNMAAVQVATDYVFRHLKKYDSANTVNGTPDISLPDDFLWLETIQIPATTRKLWPEEEQRLSEIYPNYRTRTGDITNYYFSEGGKLGLWQVPSGVFLVSYGYYRRPATLVNPTDISDLPLEWHPYVCQKAITMGLRYDGASTTESTNAEARMLVGLGASLYRRRDETLVLGKSSGRSKPPSPRLPANFPSPRRR